MLQFYSELGHSTRAGLSVGWLVAGRAQDQAGDVRDPEHGPVPYAGEPCMPREQL